MPLLVTQLLADVCRPEHILGISGGLDTYKLKPFQDIYGSKIYMLNNKKTSLYKKFQEEHNIHSVYLIVSLYDDFNRKPCTGMWEFMEFQLNDNIKVQRNKSLWK